jgi:hypothetical protein
VTAARRHKGRSPAQSFLDAAIQRIHTEAAGVLDMMIIRPTDLRGLLLAGFAGDRESAWAARAFILHADAVEKAPRHQPKLCASCPRPLEGVAFSVVAVMPSQDDPAEAIGLAVCYHCATEPAAIKDKAMTHLRTTVWPGMREIAITHEGGGRA